MFHATRYCLARKRIIGAFCLVALIGLVPGALLAEDPCTVPHPFQPPNEGFKGQCPNCGMRRAMWARTWKSFVNSSGSYHVCSFHCLADMARKSGEEPRHVKTALYLEPEQMLPVEKAAFVIGARASGTMSMTSKLAFASESAAQNFVRACGGRVVVFATAFAEARQSLTSEKTFIARKRHQTGKILTPLDQRDECPVCFMYPARYPKNRCQIQTADKTVYHFCSVRCLFAFLADPYKFVKKDVSPLLIWVSDARQGDWISARTAYYVVGSKEWGPMGHEAFAFDTKTDAQNFKNQRGGRILTYPEMGPDKIAP